MHTEHNNWRIVTIDSSYGTRYTFISKFKAAVSLGNPVAPVGLQPSNRGAPPFLRRRGDGVGSSGTKRMSRPGCYRLSDGPDQRLIARRGGIPTWAPDWLLVHGRGRIRTGRAEWHLAPMRSQGWAWGIRGAPDHPGSVVVGMHTRMDTIVHEGPNLLFWFFS